ncbi:MAG: LysM peptidoglycan-binding domain-containing protein [Anaerolineales bacterium]|nr:LysM peptidoglycan-binding domain-containing protein [Anaerolineales bacterium]
MSYLLPKGSVILAMILLLSACWGGSEEQRPATATAIVTPVATVAARTTDPAGDASATAAPVPAGATASAGPATLNTAAVQSVIATVTITPTAQAPTLTALTGINIRSGPGLEYLVLGSLQDAETASVSGRSADGLWWQIACPTTVTSTECWVIGGEFVQVQLPEVAAIVAAPPVPTTAPPTPTPSPEPCVVSQPTGWSRYRVREGDTLYAIALRSGVTVAQLQATNCLEDDMIVSDESILVPAAGGGAVTSSSRPASGIDDTAGDFVSSSGGGAQPSTYGVSHAGTILSMPSPNAGDCPTISSFISTTTVLMGDSLGTERNKFEPGEFVCIYGVGFDLDQINDPTVLPPTRREAERLNDIGPVAVWRLPLAPSDENSPVRSISVTSGIAQSAATTLTVAPPSKPRILVVPGWYVIGEPVEIYLVHLPLGSHPLYLARAARRLSHRRYCLPQFCDPPAIAGWTQQHDLFSGYFRTGAR